MITSFVQYTLMAPSYIAVLNVYAVSPSTPPRLSPPLTCPYRSSQTCTTSRGVRKATTKLRPILGPSRPRRTKAKWRWRCRRARRILIRCMRMLYMFCRRSRRRRRRRWIRRRRRRIIIGLLGQSESLLRVTLVFSHGC